MSNQQQSQHGRGFKVVLIGVMAAVVFAGSWIQIPFFAESRIHLGNIMCLLSAFILGPVGGGLAAGIGSAFFDLTNPLYISSLPFTLVFKFLMAFVCGKIALSEPTSRKKDYVGATAGILTYIVLYLGKNLIRDLLFLGLEVQPALIAAGTRFISSAINGALAVFLAVPLAYALKKGLSKAGFEL